MKLLYRKWTLIVPALLSLLTELPRANAQAEASVQPASYRGAAEPSTPPEVYGQGVRETQWQSPAEEQRGFHLPPGFEIELFASEPQVSKPLNMAWDSRGRLWVTCTVEYPYPAKAGTIPRDTIRILEDTDSDGRADKVTTFAEGLNIPIGLLPVPDGVICFSIPNIWYLKDSDGDDHVDERIKLLGPFDTTRDTHGMVNSLSRGSDGWIYACHGFNNQSTVTAADGSSVTLHSGNTFRFKQDGSRIEHFTHGQVNPFGLTRDEFGNWYSADCHSKPLTALIAGAYYPSFGRPHDGLGFAPDMMQHLHGSTAICGLVYYQAAHFPEAYRHLFFSGNVMTSRINCNQPKWQGATVTAVEMPDFLTSDDPWFRPVDIQLGPDGGLYVADFYNKIIGHYEVPLEHPGRDRESGRIWRIVYRGEQSHESSTLSNELTGSGLAATLAERLASANLTVRRLAIEQAIQAKEPPQAALLSTLLDESQRAPLRQSALEILHRRRGLPASSLAALIGDREPLVQALALSLATEMSPAVRQSLLVGVRDRLSASNHPQVRKAAVRFLGHSGDAGDVMRLLKIASDEGAEQEQDTALVHAARLSARQLLRTDAVLEIVAANWLGRGANATSGQISPPLEETLAGVLPGVDSALAARALLALVTARGDAASKDQLQQAIDFGSKHFDSELSGQLLNAIETFSIADPLARASLFQQLLDKLDGSGVRTAAVTEFGSQVQQRLIAELEKQLETSGPGVDWIDGQGVTWEEEPRTTSDGRSVQLMSSLSRSEQYTGTLRSETVDCPAELTFLLAGHNGFPKEEDHRKNRVRLVQMTSGQTLAEAFPPRSDIAKVVTWKLQEHVGQPVRVEVSDGDSASAYAWLAVGRFSLPQLRRAEATHIVDAIDGLLRRGIGINGLAASLGRLTLSGRQRGKLVSAALAGQGSQPLATLSMQALALGRADLVTPDLLSSHGEEGSRDHQTSPGNSEGQTSTGLEPSLLNKKTAIAKELCATATASQQSTLARGLLASASGCELLQVLIDQGTLSLSALQGVDALLPGGLPAELEASLAKLLEEAARLPAATTDFTQRVANLDWNRATVSSGHAVYKQHCGICHQFGKEGNLVGPQLDGVKLRGAQRLSEDILDPHRNVDQAFRITSLLLNDDTVVSGLVRDEADGSVTIVGQDGKSRSLPANSISERRQSGQSLMPSNFAELLNDEQLASLLKFLAESS